MSGDIVVSIEDQEVEGEYKFSGLPLMTANFEHTFGADAKEVLNLAMGLLRIRVEQGADYLQVFYADGTKFWAIDDGKCFTFLMPEDY